uniref:Uncharacterized protein n=1 Tax=Brassica oleracea TaxID=3712 RepID=A0A3P6F4Y3_BRAOL|nr:unnamed protein product [Brassica oleracea]
MAQIVETTFTAEENNQTLAPVPATKTAKADGDVKSTPHGRRQPMV